MHGVSQYAGSRAGALFSLREPLVPRGERITLPESGVGRGPDRGAGVEAWTGSYGVWLSAEGLVSGGSRRSWQKRSPSHVS